MAANSSDRKRRQEGELIQGILSSKKRFNGVRGEVSKQLLEYFFERHCNDAAPASQADLLRFFPDVDLEWNSNVRRAVRRLDKTLADYFATEGARHQLRVRIPLRQYRLEFFRAPRKKVESLREWFWKPYLDPDVPTRLIAYEVMENDVWYPRAGLPTFCGFLVVMEKLYLSSFLRKQGIDVHTRDFESEEVSALLESAPNLIVLVGPKGINGMRTILNLPPWLDYRHTKASGGGLSTIVNRRVSARRRIEDTLCDPSDGLVKIFSLVTRFSITASDGGKRAVTIISSNDDLTLAYVLDALRETGWLRSLRGRYGFDGPSIPDRFQLVCEQSFANSNSQPHAPEPQVVSAQIYKSGQQLRRKALEG